MKVTEMKYWSASLVVLLGALIPVHLCADDKVWNGGGSDSQWSSASNWEGGILPVSNADALIFDGTLRLNNTNDLTADSKFSAVTFATNAGPFVLNGNAIAAVGTPLDFNNLSTHTATINLPVHAGTAATLWTTSSGDLIMNGALSSSAASSIHGAGTLWKDGLKTLTLGGEVSLSHTTPAIKILGGTLMLDLESGGSLTPNTLLHYGLTGSSGGDINYQGGTLAIRGKRAGTSSQTLGDLTIFNGTSISRICVDPNGGDGTTLTVGNVWTWAGNGFFHINLSQLGATLVSTPSVKNGIVGLWCTVTDTEKTGFATTNAVGQIIRNAQLAPYPWLYTGTADATNYVVSGSGTVGGTPRLATLTIQSGGTFSCNSWITAKALLMEEGVSDYTFSMPRFGLAGSFLHQHSTVGNLIFDCKLESGFYKTGPGTVILKTNTLNTNPIRMEILEGLVQVEATLTGNPNIFNGGHLGGFGSVDGNLTVYPGGTLDGAYTTASALTVDGNLLLKDRSSVSMELAQTAFSPLQVTGTVTNQGANLSVTLPGRLTGVQEITVLTSDTAIEGEFTSVNGTPLSLQKTFSLSNDSETYRFELLSSPTRVWVEVVSRPGTQITIR